MSRKSLEQLIAEAHDSMEFGTVVLTLKKSSGNLTTIDMLKHTSRGVSGSAQALTLIGSMLKLLKEAEDTGSLTFTVVVDRGEATKLITQDFSRKSLRGGEYQ